MEIHHLSNNQFFLIKNVKLPCSYSIFTTHRHPPFTLLYCNTSKTEKSQSNTFWPSNSRQNDADFINSSSQAHFSKHIHTEAPLTLTFLSILLNLRLKIFTPTKKPKKDLLGASSYNFCTLNLYFKIFKYPALGCIFIGPSFHHLIPDLDLLKFYTPGWSSKHSQELQFSPYKPLVILFSVLLNKYLSINFQTITVLHFESILALKKMGWLIAFQRDVFIGFRELIHIHVATLLVALDTL